MAMSPGVVDLKRQGRHSHKARMSSGIGIARRRSGLSASRRTKARVSVPSQISVLAAHHAVVLDEDLGVPLLDVGRDPKLLGVGGGGDEAGRDLEQRRADDAPRLDQLAPWRHTALHEERERRRIHPALEVGIEDDSGGIAVTELDRDIDVGRLRHAPRIVSATAERSRRGRGRGTCARRRHCDASARRAG